MPAQSSTDFLTNTPRLGPRWWIRQPVRFLVEKHGLCLYLWERPDYNRDAYAEVAESADA